MAYFGVIRKVWDNQKKDGNPYWGVVIDTEAKGEVTFTLFDAAMAGHAKDGEEPIFDVHEAAENGRRVLFDVVPGKEKPGGGTYPATLKLIQYADEAEVPPIGSLLADEGRSPKVEAAVGIAKHLEDAQRHLGAAMELARGM